MEQLREEDEDAAADEADVEPLGAVARNRELATQKARIVSEMAVKAPITQHLSPRKTLTAASMARAAEPNAKTRTASGRSGLFLSVLDTLSTAFAAAKTTGYESPGPSLDRARASLMKRDR